MDPDLIRLILVILGVLLVAGIYLWDRYKRGLPREPMVRQAPREDVITTAEAAHVRPDSHPVEPRIDTLPETPPSMTADAQTGSEALRVDEPARSDVLDPEPADIGNWDRVTGDGDPQFTMQLNFDAHDDGDYLSTDPALHDEVERKLIVLHLVGAQGELRGPAIEKACLSAHLRLGEMSIYHYHDGASGKVLFSVASMVEPGSFPVDDMEGFVSPGLTLFTQLPGARDGLEIYETMLKTGRKLASLLHAELQDERHNKLTGQMERHIAESIIEHRHRLKLARSRH